MNYTRDLLTATNDLHVSWKDILGNEFNKPYMKNLFSFLLSEIDKDKIIYPPISNWFEALKRTSFKEVSVVIMGQDPYHGEGQAHGLSFSVKPEIVIPATLRNIFKELVEDTKVSEPSHGCLTSWSEQGILLLNTIFTVEKSLPGSHKNKGWEIFTNKIIEELSSRKKNLVFILWGKDAHEQRGNATVITAMVPLANMFGYINNLRSMSQGRAQYSMFFDHYSKVPQNVQDEVTKKIAG